MLGEFQMCTFSRKAEHDAIVSGMICKSSQLRKTKAVSVEGDDFAKLVGWPGNADLYRDCAFAQRERGRLGIHSHLLQFCPEAAVMVCAVRQSDGPCMTMTPMTTSATPTRREGVIALLAKPTMPKWSISTEAMS